MLDTSRKITYSVIGGNQFLDVYKLMQEQIKKNTDTSWY